MVKITPEEARAYSDRWATVEAFQLEELRRTPMETKLLQLVALMASRDLFAYDAERDKGVLEVRKRWAQLRLPLGRYRREPLVSLRGASVRCGKDGLCAGTSGSGCSSERSERGSQAAVEGAL